MRIPIPPCLLVLSTTLAATAPLVAQPRDTLAVLNERVPQVSFVDAPLEMVFEWIGDYARVDMAVRWPALTQLGIERDKPISLRVRNLRFGDVLGMVLQEAAGPDVALAYTATGELITISTAEDLNRPMIVRVYDVSDLLARVPRFANAPAIELSAAPGEGGQSALRDAGHATEDTTPQAAAADPQVRALMDVIVNTVEPDSWLQNRGRGTIQAFGRQLVVWNTLSVHQALGGPVVPTD